jgi:hypothetical protein
MSVFKNFSIVYPTHFFLPWLLLVRKVYVFDIFSIYHFIKIRVSLVLFLITDDDLEFYKTPVDKTARLDSLKSVKSHTQTQYHHFQPGNSPFSLAMFMECQSRHTYNILSISL